MSVSKTVVVDNHERFFLQAGYLLFLQFNQGWVGFRIKGGEPTNVKPYPLATNLAAATSMASWDEIIDASARRYLEPPEEYYINHVFWGATPRRTRVYFQYETRRDRWNLVAVTRVVSGDVGYVDGEMSPYEGPFSFKSEVFTLHELYPAFRAHNPLSYAMPKVMMNFDIMRYTFKLVKDKSLIRNCLQGRTTCRKHTVGGIDPSPAVAPDWLTSLVGKELFDYSNQVVEEGM